MFVKQISVFLENTPGSLRELTHLLGSNGIDLMALSVADTQNFGIIRIIIEENSIDNALRLLRSAGFTARVNNVVCAVVEDVPLGLCKLLELIEETGASVEYMYSFLRSTGDRALMILRLSDQEISTQKLIDLGVQLTSQAEVNAL
ncbi:MAG: acetolactate synthase [Clostridia bacterium]|nr:acetolactate synthase [Clostridia bacterium]